jgi:hypothetical protein
MVYAPGGAEKIAALSALSPANGKAPTEDAALEISALKGLVPQEEFIKSPDGNGPMSSVGRDSAPITPNFARLGPTARQSNRSVPAPPTTKPRIIVLLPFPTKPREETFARRVPLPEIS